MTASKKSRLHAGRRMSRHALAACIGTALMLSAELSPAQTGQTATSPDSRTGVFELGTIEVQGTRLNASAPGEEVTTRQDMERYNRNTVGDAVNTLPGVSLSHNPRNEDMVYVRGFDVRQVPVFLDSIPLYVPYDGYVDFARFTTFDLSEIRVAKGDASVLYGPNVMGGAINLVSRKPTKALEGDIGVGVATGAGQKVTANVGSNQGPWYFQASGSYLAAHSFPLPGGFHDEKKIPTDTGDERADADRTDKRASFKIGLTPNATDEYALGYAKQDAEKGNPVYTGAASNGIRYWRWPYWDKQSLYFISNTQLGGDYTLKTRIYQDKYSNRLDAYTDDSYTKQLINSSYPSFYNDKTNGASVELVNVLGRHELHLAAHYKEDQHEEHTLITPIKRYRDVTQSIAAEDSITLSERTGLRVGVSHDWRDAREVYYWPKGETHTNNGLIALTHNLSDNQRIYASVARKSRFPTIKDRYSARMGTALPNPDLKPEQADHVELGWRGDVWADGHAQASLFYSHIDDLIQNQVVASRACGGSTCNQAQNIGKARHRGAELSFDQQFGQQWRLGANYTYLNGDNLSNHVVPLTDTPTHKLFAQAGWSGSEAWELMATFEAETGRTVSYAVPGPYPYRRLGGFGVLGAKTVWNPRLDLSLEIGVRNLGDKYYELADGYPMAGRAFYANASFRY